MVLYILLGVLPLLSLYLWHVNRSLSGTPDHIKPLACPPFTDEAIKKRYAEIQKEGHAFAKHLPPATSRRYIVTGGAGYLGKWAVLHLIQRGESPSAIRIVDIRDPVAVEAHDDIRGADKFNEYEPLRKACASVEFVKTDITDPQSVREAFEKPWPKEHRDKGLTVFHCAAVIRHWERARIFLPRQARVNVDGTRNVLAAAKAAGATVLISTSSSSVGVRRPKHWVWPWQRWAAGLAQIIGDDSPNLPREKDEFFSNYSYTKFLAEGYVREADEKGKKGGLRTGIVRPGNGIHGPGGDFTAGTYLRLGGGPSWIAHIIQDFIYVENCMLAHLLYERRLLDLAANPSLPDIGGHSFLVTDPNPPVRFADVYHTLEVLSLTKVKFSTIPPIALFPASHLVEWYDILTYYVKALPKLGFPLVFVQPALFGVSSVHTILDDSKARKSAGEGGLAYAPPVDTLSGLCFQVEQWNENVQKEKGAVQEKVDVGAREGLDEVLEKAAVPVQRKA